MLEAGSRSRWWKILKATFKGGRGSRDALRRGGKRFCVKEKIQFITGGLGLIIRPIEARRGRRQKVHVRWRRCEINRNNPTWSGTRRRFNVLLRNKLCGLNIPCTHTHTNAHTYVYRWGFTWRYYPNANEITKRSNRGEFMSRQKYRAWNKGLPRRIFDAEWNVEGVIKPRWFV